MKKSDDILNALGQAYLTLSSHNKFEDSIVKVLSILGKSTDVDRIYIFQNFENEEGVKFFSQKYEWARESISIQIDNPILQNIDWALYKELYAVLSHRKTYSAIVENIEEELMRESLQSQQIKAVIIVPIFSNDYFWGWVGFDNCQTNEVFSKSQQDALLVLASTIGNVIAMQKQQTEIQLANERLKTALNTEIEVNKLKTRFVSIASHEFRTPLSTISGSTELMELYLKDIPNFQISEKCRKHINNIKKEINRMTILLDDTLILEKQSLGKYTFNPTYFSLNAFIENFIEENYTSNNGIKRIVIKLPKEPIEIYTDNQILPHILSNLIDNALKYSDENSFVECVVKASANKVKISIIDKGIGIPKNEQKHLFESFFRSSNVVGIVGTGLGLNIVKQFIEIIKGEITFKSMLNIGSEFNVILPLKPQN